MLFRSVAVFGGDVVISGTLYDGSGNAYSIGGGGGGGDSFFSSNTGGTIFTTGSVAFKNNESGINKPTDKGDDVFFYVSGSTSDVGTSDGKVSLFGGAVVISGSIFPGTDLGANLGSPSRRWGNIYTGDLHLRNDRGNWTIVEEEDYLCVVKIGRAHV